MHYNTAHRNTANFCLGVSFALILVFILALNTFAQTKGVRVINNSTQKTVSGETYAIVVGISNYPGITPLKFADKDAQMFIDFLKSPAGGNTKPENILPLINGDARAADFNVKGYAWLKQKALKEGDRLYIYFSGHGDAMNEDNYFLLPYDCMPNKEDNNYLGTGNIDMHKVKTLFIKPLAAKKVEVLLIVDACRSNDLPGGQQGQANFSNSLQSIAESKQGEIIMLSTGAGQVAIESSKIGMGHGLFTWYLIAGLSGDADKEGDAADHDGKVSLVEIASYVKNRVRKEAKEMFSTNQVPVFLPPDMELKTIAVVDSGTYSNWKIANAMMQQTNGNTIAMAKKKPNEKSVTDDSYADTALISLDNKFIAAIKNGDLLGDNSAEDFYNQMLKKWPGKPITEDAKYALATEFINFGQEKINLFLSGKSMVHIQRMEKELSKSGERGKKISANVAEQVDKMKALANTDFSTAAEMMEKATKLLIDEPELLEPIYPKLYFLKGAAYDAIDNITLKRRGIAYIKKSIQKDSTAAYNYLMLGHLLNDINSDSCEMYYKKAISLAPKWTNPLNGLGIYYNKKHNYKLAIIQYKKALLLDTINDIIYQNVGAAYDNLKQPDSARIYYLKALSINACDSYANGNMASYYIDSVKQESTNDRFFILAAQHLKKALRCDPTNGWLYSKMSQLFDKINARDSSIYYLNKGIRQSPQDASLHRYLADEYLSLKDTAKAENAYRAAMLTDSLDVNNYVQLGLFYKKCGTHASGNNLKLFDKAIAMYQQALKLDPNNLNTFIGIGNVYYQLKTYDKALLNYQLAIKTDSTSAVPYFNNGLIYYNLKNYDKAILSYQKSIQLNPYDASAYNELGDVYYELKDYNKAITYYQQSYAHDSTFAIAYRNVGDAYYNLKTYDKAIVYYQKAVKVNPVYTSAYKNIGDAYFEQTKYDEAIAYYQKALKCDSNYTVAYGNIGDAYYNLKDYHKSLSYYQKAVQKDPTLAKSYRNLADAYYELKSYAIAITNYQKAIALDTTAAKSYKSLADVYYDSNIYDKAIVNYKKAIQLDPANALAYKFLGNSLFEQKKYSEAIPYYLKAVSLDSTSAKTYTSLGDAYYELNNYDKAIINYQRAVQIDPSSATAYKYIGDAYYQQNNYNKAMPNFQKAIQLNPTYASAYKGLGDCYYELKTYDTALVVYQKALKLNPASGDTYYNLGLIYNNQNDPAAALLNFQKAAEIDSTDAGTYYNIGLNYYKLKTLDKAIINYQKAIQHRTAFPSAYYGLGNTYRDIKDYDKAIAAYQKALAIDTANFSYLTGLGYAYVYNNDYKNGVACFQKTLATNTDNANAYYNLTCAWALANNTAKSLETLQQALESGFKDYAHIMQDDDIKALKTLPEFTLLMKKYFPDKAKD